MFYSASLLCFLTVYWHTFIVSLFSLSHAPQGCQLIICSWGRMSSQDIYEGGPLGPTSVEGRGWGKQAWAEVEKSCCAAGTSFADPMGNSGAQIALQRCLRLAAMTRLLRLQKDNCFTQNIKSVLWPHLFFRRVALVIFFLIVIFGSLGNYYSDTSLSFKWIGLIF